MFGKLFTRLLLLFVMFIGTACANSDEATIKKTFQEKYPNRVVDSVKKVPLSGLYEVVVSGNIIYTDTKVEYLLVGDLVDTKTKRSLTEQRLQEVNKVSFDGLPFDLAIKQVKGNGKRKLAIFSDPDCPYCKRLEKETIAEMTDVTIYTFLYPLDSLHPDAPRKSTLVWCAPDRAKAWYDLMLKGVEPAGEGKCETPLAKIAQLAGKLRISGTPGIILENGQLIPGAVAKDKLEELLNNAAKK